MQGPLTFATVPALLDAELSGDQSLAGVTQIDSAGLSLLLELKRRASARGVMLGFTQVPAAVRQLADHFDVSGILGIKA